MDWEAFEKHKAFAGKTVPSMLRRRVGHDYEARAIYLVTMTVEGRLPLLGTLVGNADAPDGSPNAPRIAPTPLGQEVERCWQSIPHFYPEVRPLALQLMPDHLHGILFVTQQMDQPLGMVLKGFKAGCNKAFRQLGYAATMLQQRGPVLTSKAPSAPAPSALAQRGPAPSAPAQRGPAPGAAQTSKAGFLFARNYNDHILEGAGELERWFQYLHDNPRRLAVKRQHPDYFSVYRNICIGEWPSCQIYGNHFLLTVPERAAVIVHGAYDDAKYAELKEQWLALARRGGVLVSAAIAPREKLVMREAMDKGFRLILLREHGFPELYKPSGEAFNACSEGRLLQISPWKYQQRRKTISREQCLQLNRMAEYIAKKDIQIQ